MRIFVIVALIAIVFSLASALIYLVKDMGGSDRTVKALSWRIGLSLGLFLLLMIGAYTGLITPGRL